jgi:outer membrane protein insertion porin family
MVLLGACTRGVRNGPPELLKEEKQPFVNKIVLVGNEAFSDKKLKKQMYTKESTIFSIFRKPRLRTDFLRRDVANIEAFYHASGFLEAEVTLRELVILKDEAFVDIIIDIRESEATRVESVAFRHESVVAEKDLRKDLQLTEGDPYNPTVLESDVYAIKRRYFDKGFLAVEVADSVEVTERRVAIEYTIEPGPVIQINEIEIRGNVLTKTSILEKELTVKTGEVFRLSKALESQRNLFETGLFTEAEIIPENLDTERRTVDLVVRVRERKSAYVEAGFGVGNVLGSRVVGEWGDRNLFGTGRRLRLKSEYSFGIFKEGTFDFEDLDPRVKFYRYDVEFNQRHVFGTKVLLGFNAFLEKDATVDPIVIRTTGLLLGGKRRVRRNTEVFLDVRQERIERESPDIDNEKSTSRIIGATIAHDTRNFILDPRTGGYRNLRLELAGGLLGGDNDFYTMTGTYQKYVKLGWGVVLGLRTRAGFADAYGNSATVPIENRYFTGGGNSVRGYDENSLGPTTTSSFSGEDVIGGRVLLLTNAELRYPLPLLSRFNFSGTLFVDGGNVWASLKAIDPKNFRLYADESDVEQEDYRYSVGLGIRYNTPVGPIRLDFGVPVKQEEGVSSGRFHISLGQIF